MNVGKILGIDLGTTNSVVTVYDGDKDEYIPIPSLEGNPLIRSAFFIKNNIVKVGDKALIEVEKNPENVILSVKSSMNEPRKQFVIKDAINLAGDIIEKSFNPVDISTYILTYIKRCAETYIGSPVTDVVISVPAYFRELERRATKISAEKAGLNVMEIINEPTAACLSYGYANSISDDGRNILVYDLGGGTFDVTYLNLNPVLYEVLDTDGMKIGGDDIDKQFAVWIQKKIRVGNCNSVQVIRIAEEAKKRLSDEIETEVDFTSYGGEKLIVTCQQFESIISPIVYKTIVKVSAIIENKSVDEVVLVGGSTRIPLIRKRLTELLNLPDDYFNKYSVNPDLAVSIGACIRGRIILGDTDITLLDKTQFNLGIEDSTGNLIPVIRKGSVIPTMGEENFTANEDARYAEFRVFQGNEPLAANNQYLGTIRFEFDSLIGGQNKFRVSLILDSSAVLEVSVLNFLTGERKEIAITDVM